ncbi:MAG: SUMF1/EgtB/PvdO family nonheme iron enzyme [Myxococcota bacterium]|nr:SUMF1/EgtB/PvdO family nonheme iron enzyme [Myxococcota bacterium]MBP8971687.1 SUMF1/EgtB/PvdO family nonheme iron enzyme [Myxococcota bacterium]
MPLLRHRCASMLAPLRGSFKCWVCSRPDGNPAQGLCDMAGNVLEWVEDSWHDNYKGAPRDGSAWVSRKIYRKVTRDGA